MAEPKRFAMVCAANMNRSMEAHKVLQQAGLNVSSYGAGNHVKLPGASKDSPNVYNFGQVTYREIYDDLMSKDPELYRRNGLRDMLERNMKIKSGPQRWQEHSEELDVVVCFEERVFDNVVEDMRRRGGGGEPMLVINLDVKDSHDEALLAAPQALKLCRMIEASEDWECECDEIMDKFQAEEEGRRPIYSICFNA